MKINFKQLIDALATLKYDYGYSDGAIEGVEFDLEVSKEDPGNGVFVDAIKLKHVAEIENKLMTRELEIYCSSSNEDPAFTKSSTKRLKKEDK